MNGHIRKLAALCLAFLTLLLLGCSSEEQQAGIKETSYGTVYTVIMSAGDRISIFPQEGSVKKIAVQNSKGEVNIVNWCNLKDGGAIAWVEDRVRYLPESCMPLRTVQFSSLTSTSRAMTLEEARQYIPYLKDEP